MTYARHPVCAVSGALSYTVAENQVCPREEILPLYQASILSYHLLAVPFRMARPSDTRKRHRAIQTRHRRRTGGETPNHHIAVIWNQLRATHP
jgi:hypothetical protein